MRFARASSDRFLMLALVLYTALMPLHLEASDTRPPNIITVLSEGYGKDVAEASQNAAQNALTSMVGMFIDAETVLQKKSIINGAIKTEIKRIDRNIKEYSQGSVSKFEILTVSQNGLTKVTAKVTVRIEDFKAFARKAAEGETQVNTSLFAQMATEKKQRGNIGNILYDNILIPLASGEVTRVEVGNPTSYSQSGLNSYDHRYFIEKHGTDGIIVLPVTVSLDPDYKENLLRTLDSISIYKTDMVSDYFRPFGTIDGFIYDLQSSDRRTTDEDAIIIIKAVENQTEQWMSYVLKGALPGVIKRSPLGRSLSKKANGFETGILQNIKESLIIEVVDKNNRVLKIEKGVYHQVNDKTFIEGNWDRDTKQEDFIYPWRLIGIRDKHSKPLIILIERKFNILIAIDHDVLSKASAIRVKITKPDLLTVSPSSDRNQRSGILH